MNEVCLIFCYDFKWWKLMLFPGLCCWGEWYQLIQSNESSAVLKMVNLSYISHWCQILIQKLRDGFVLYLADILNTLLQLNKSQHRLAVTLLIIELWPFYPYNL